MGDVRTTVGEASGELVPPMQSMSICRMARALYQAVRQNEKMGETEVML